MVVRITKIVPIDKLLTPIAIRAAISYKQFFWVSDINPLYLFMSSNLMIDYFRIIKA